MRIHLIVLSVNLLGLLMVWVPLPTQAQSDYDSDWQVQGYVKNMQTALFIDQDGESTYLQDNLIHQRLRLDWTPSTNWHVRMDLRTRIFYGDLVRQTPDYGEQIDDVNNDFFDWSVVLFSGDSWVGHSMIDRFYVEYIQGDWEITLGRQRVNWGISTVWNPNDVFNAFAFTDFDYEERPGSDVLRVKKYTSFASSVEGVIRIADRMEEAIIAGLWSFNKQGYDFQVLGGYVQNQWAMGGGWAGNIKTAGFKGEFTLFFPNGNTGENVSFSATTGVDYAFEKGLYLGLGYLYNSQGQTDGSILQLFDFELSAQNLYPYRHALFFQTSQPLTPLLSTGMAFIYSPVRSHPLFVNPSFTCSIGTNWDLDLIGQLVWNRDKGYNSPLQAAFLRVKFSF